MTPRRSLILGSQLATFGEVERAIELTRRALATEPLRANWYNWLAMYLLGLNRLDEAERAIRRAIELQPRAVGYYGRLTNIEIKRGHVQAALAAAQQEPSGAFQDVALALARQIGTDRSAADAALKTLIDKDASAVSPIRSPRSTRCATMRRKPSSGSTGPWTQPRCRYQSASLRPLHPALQGRSALCRLLPQGRFTGAWRGCCGGLT